MKYDITAMAGKKIFSYMLRSYYKKYLPEKDFMSVKKRLKKEYKQMVLRTPGIGGRKNSLSGNLTAACYLFALPKADPSVTPELFDDIIAKSIALPLFAKMHAKKKKEGAIFAEEKQNRRVAEAERSQNSPYEMDWQYTYVKGKDEFYCTYTQCGICKLAKREHSERFLPCLCKTDYTAYDLLGAELFRTKTLANGDDCCDFHVVKKQA